MKLMLTAVVLALVAGTVSTAEQDETLQRIMQRKLDHAHALLEGVILEDYGALEESAAALRALSEEAGWFVNETAEYAERSAEFRRAVAQIESAAKEKNSESAALGYVDMTLKCVQCHRHLRGSARVDLDMGQLTRSVGISAQRAGQ